MAAVLDWRLDPTHLRGTRGPLPWLPGIPAGLREHPEWGPYLTARSAQITTYADQVRHHVRTDTPTSAPAWAALLLVEDHSDLRADLAVFRAAHAVPDDDLRPTGKPQLAAADRRSQRRLDQRVAAAIDTSYRTAWTPLGVQVGLTPSSDPHWSYLVEHLAALSRAGADAPALLRAAAAKGPLPDESQAAALWWRIARHTSPAVLTPDTGPAPLDPLRPSWLPQLTAALGEDTTQQLLTDPHWPAVVTALTRAINHGIPTRDVLRAPLGPDGNPVPDHALADALIYRAAVLTDPPPPDPAADPADPDLKHDGDTGPVDGDPEDPDHLPPEDLDMLPYTGGDQVPLNLDEQGYRDGPDYDHYLRTGDLTPLLPDETLPTAETTLPADELEVALFQAAQHRQWMEPWQPTDEQQRRLETRAADAEFSPVTPERIANLNDQAARFYEHTYRGSWAQTYLTDRLGTDLTGDPAVQPGYAPAGFTTLTAHLRRHGATDQELLAAGLAKTASTGRTIDTFRDRLVLPIHHHGRIVGFVARRHPDHDGLEPGTDAAIKAGPKYLNTADTVLYSKSDQLYGLAEHADRLTSGVTPVLVEGPIDALAVTLASPDHVGAAPLGTSLTDAQADTLTHPGNVIVATDGDLAGQLAAERDYWMLTARGADPRHAAFPAGQDPAGILTTHGPAALQDLLTHATPLADALITERLNHLPPDQALPAALTVVAAGSSDHWRPRTADIARRLHVPVDAALTALLPHVSQWDRDRPGTVAIQHAATRATRDRLTGAADLDPATRWAPFARQISPALTRGHDWADLADALDYAARHGVDVHALVPYLASRQPLEVDHPATDLRYRLVAETDVPIDSAPESSVSALLDPSRESPTPHPRTGRHQPAPRQTTLKP